MKKIFICHAGRHTVSDSERECDMGVIGMAYVWNGEWIRSPEDVEHTERDPVMILHPIFNPEIQVWGDVSCFTSIERLEAELLDG
ncbi:hypothetical protein CUZ56_01188 [Saezia sanguinis]|uniref:Uncharacterized protein n=1 Tax=Saezia sanguinis TaxID=1965230 RepID=A0A433SET9_9BURK|nr:hypothetical protein [Saezia sanguinis]RUS67245.1 hypothetical protein CUZ56_01188 [Saezia sanguinis]